MTNCKNCKYTDEYCASGDCNKIQANNLACNKISLTEQWRKGELQDGWYWVKKKTCEEYIDKVYFWYDTFIDGDVPLDNDKVVEVLAKVPSYEKWQAKLEENAELKELLKECRPYIGYDTYEFDAKVHKLLTKIDEALK